MSDIERTLYRQGMGALVVLIVYDVLAPAIERQLEAMQVEMRDDPGAVERYAKDPVLEQRTAATWPGNAAQRFSNLKASRQ